MNLATFSIRDLQNFLALATVAEADGVTDLRFVRQRLQNYITSQVGENKKQQLRTRRANYESKSPEIGSNSCPKCGSKKTIIQRVDSLSIFECRSCWFSMLDGASK